MPLRVLVPIILCLVSSATAGAAEPTTPARFLAVTVTAGFRHASIAAAEVAIEEMGRSSGLFHVDFLRMPPGRLPQPQAPRRGKETSDAEWQKQQEAFKAAQEQFAKDDAGWQATLKAKFATMFAPETLGSFDGLMFVNTTGDLPVPDLSALLDWVKSGKSFVGMHSATDTFGKSDAYCDFIGGNFAGHPWNAGGEHAFVVHEPGHRLTAMFPQRFRWKDEIYQYDLRSKPENLRVLVSLDMSASTPKEPWHVPVSWVRNYGKGRVFYTNFGHNDATWQDPMFQRHMLEGIAWSLGRFDVPVEPNPEVQAAEYLRSAIAAAAAATGGNADDLLAKADAMIAKDPSWAVGLRPMLLELRGLKPDARAGLYEKLLADIAK
ncbi:MAG: ThuA domain-containing protein [Planctomycetia bacterium]